MTQRAKRMYVLLVHGTWAGAARWTHDGSLFRARLESALQEDGYEVRFETFPWDGRNRWRGRAAVAEEVSAHLRAARRERDADWEFLVVAHSHGGNICTDAARARLADEPDFPLRGVVCLNTPFLKHEPRSASKYLLVWICVLVSLALLALGLGGLEGAVALPKLPLGLERIAGAALPRVGFVASLLVTAGVLACLRALSARVHRAQSAPQWKPRPAVLCLSCPDDEAITFLGLGEGISNLPQLLLQPLALAAAGLTAGALLGRTGAFSIAGLTVEHHYVRLSLAGFVLLGWIWVALAGGLVGAGCLALAFGLSPRQAVETLVSRVLVSYVPLQPAEPHFRGIAELPLRWGSPLQLLHSGIYESAQTVEELSDWIRSQT